MLLRRSEIVSPSAKCHRSANIDGSAKQRFQIVLVTARLQNVVLNHFVVRPVSSFDHSLYHDLAETQFLGLTNRKSLARHDALYCQH